MPNEPVSERLCLERQEKQNERFARDLKRLEQLEESNEDLKKLTIEIKNLVKLNNDRLDRQEERLSAIEQRPLHWWEKVCGGNRHSVRRSDRRLSAHDDCPGDYQGVVVKQVKEEKE